MRLMPTGPPQRLPHQVQSVSFCSDGTMIASGSMDGTIRVWNSASGAEILKMQGQKDGILSSVFSPDGRRIVSGSYDETVCVCAYRMGRVGKVLSGWKSQPLYETLSWDPGTGCQLHLTEQPDHCSLDITHDGWIGDSTTNRTLSKLPTMVSAAKRQGARVDLRGPREVTGGWDEGWACIHIPLSAQSVNDAWYRGRNI
jgi:WD40 repeat protein